jgi:AcrR family transcriptional regulator
MTREALSRLSEQVRSTKSRPYRMRRRAELVDETRQRIVEAAMRLHTTVGPANTFISTVADEAGVTRLTVYRHFPDIEELFAACRGHWFNLHRPPDVAVWRGIPDLETRARRGLGDLYGWYRQNADDLYPINRDAMTMPAGAQAARRAESAALAGALVEGHADGGQDGRELRAIAGHLVSYWTWRSLVVEQGLSNEAAVELAVRILIQAAGARGRRVSARRTD